MRKLVISAVTAVAVLGSFVPMAAATTPTTPPTSEVAGYPPVPTSSTTSTTVEQLGPVVITPDPNVSGVVISANLPSTGSDSATPLRVAAGLLVAGVLSVVLVRRRKPAPAA
ncbi:MAG: LPXTG cell wall anchor domain-containing protein [Acidimicrobiia bacterium]